MVSAQNLKYWGVTESLSNVQVTELEMTNKAHLLLLFETEAALAPP